MVREAKETDLNDMLELYLYLHETAIPEDSQHLHVRPYAFVENVVTHEEYRSRGFASACLEYAKQIAEENNCYKMMLLTGAKSEETLNFYRNAGYNSSDKTAFIQWLNL